MEKYAIFLPQFHEIPENNEWWGQGFTEWTNVRKAKSLFKGHMQPVHPLNGNYYNLLDKETVQWQTDIASKYGIDGFVYYHYYFCGKMLLEKPAENLLRWKDINQKFMFCWANHDWCRSWQGSTELLMKQEYGDENDWENHFQYLLQFFKDERYVKKQNMPVLILFKNFERKDEVMSYFDKRCIEEGYDGLYLIEEYLGSPKKEAENKFYENLSSVTKKVFYSEPGVSMNMVMYGKFRYIAALRDKIIRIFKLKYLYKLNGNKLYDRILQEKYSDNIIHGLFFSWDSTPRHGMRGRIISEPSKERFEKVMNAYKEQDFIIINAWNEWAEGMMLEPTEENGYKYLEWLSEY